MKKCLFTLYIMLSVICGLRGQTPSDAAVMKQREFCFALSYEKGSFDQYWEGMDLRRNETIATVSRRAIMPMIAIGATDKLNFYVGAPHVKTESSDPNGGKLQGAKGFQDLTLAVKYLIVRNETTSGTLSVLAAGGFATPITNYLSDYRPYSIGNGTDEWSARGIVQYKMAMGLYGRLSAGHLFRGQTKAERDYYYANGSYFTPWMDVPSAWEYNAVVGLTTLDNSLKIEANFYGLKSTSGDDIRKYNAAQPTNKVEFGQVGANIQYFIKPVKGISVFGYYSSTLSGRNAPKISLFAIGTTYQFQI